MKRVTLVPTMERERAAAVNANGKKDSCVSLIVTHIQLVSHNAATY